jgi:hypothetical protein
MVVKSRGLPHFLDNRLTDGGDVVSIMRRPRFIPRKMCAAHFCQRLSRPPRAIVGLEGLSKSRNPMTSSGIE